MDGLDFFLIRDAPIFMKKVLRRLLRPLLEADGILGHHSVLSVRLPQTHENTAQRDEIAFFDFNLEVGAHGVAVDLGAVLASQVLYKETIP